MGSRQQWLTDLNCWRARTGSSFSFQSVLELSSCIWCITWAWAMLTHQEDLIEVPVVWAKIPVSDQGTNTVVDHYKKGFICGVTTVITGELTRAARGNHPSCCGSREFRSQMFSQHWESNSKHKINQINQNPGNHLLQTLCRTHKPKHLGGIQQSQIIINLLQSIPCTGSKKEQPDQPVIQAGELAQAARATLCPFSFTASPLWPSASLFIVHTAAGRPFTACPSSLLNPQQNNSSCPSRRLSWLILHFQSAIISSVQQQNFFQPEPWWHCFISCLLKAHIHRSWWHDLIENFNKNITFNWRLNIS